MDFLTAEYGGNAVWRWAVGALVVFGGTLALRFARNLVERKFGAFSKGTENVVDDLLVDLIRQTKTLFLVLFALALATFVVSLPPGLRDALRAAAVISLVIQGGIWAAELLTTSLKEAMKRRREEEEEDLQDEQADIATFTLLRFAGRLVIWTAVALLCLDNVGVDITAAVAGLGVTGIAVALAVQNVLGDLFASFSILLDKPFVVGDFIILGEYMGTVEKIGIKTTRVRSLSGEQLIFSNNDLLQSRIRNYKRMQERRVVFEVGVVYQTPAEKVERLPGMLREIVEAAEETRFDRAHFKAFGDSSLRFEIVYYVLSADYNRYMDTQQGINLAIFRRFEEEGIEFAYPTQMLHVASTGRLGEGNGRSTPVGNEERVGA